MTTRLTFTAGNHSYWLADPDTGKKQRLTSVTTLIKQLDAPALKRWAANTAADYAVDHWDDLAQLSWSERRSAIAGAPWQARDKAAAKGTAIHAMAEDLLHGRPVDCPDDLLPKVQGLARWLEASGVVKVAAEAMVWSEEDPDLGMCGFAGTFDMLAKHPRHGLTLVDWKTGTGVYSEYGIQIAGYATAHHIVTDDADHPMPHIEALAVAHVRADGTDLHILTPPEREIARQRFEVLRMLKTIPDPTFQMEATA
jgi:hypothetical protein